MLVIENTVEIQLVRWGMYRTSYFSGTVTGLRGFVSLDKGINTPHRTSVYLGPLCAEEIVHGLTPHPVVLRTGYNLECVKSRASPSK